MLKLIILLAIAAITAPFFIKGPDGRPLMTSDELLPISTGLSGGSEQRSELPATPSKNIYRWQDETGQWHYSDTPPAHTKSENVTLKPVNTVPALQSEAKPVNGRNTVSDRESDQTSSGAALLPGNLTGPDAVPTDMSELMRQVKEAEQRIKERQAKLDALIQNQ